MLCDALRTQQGGEDGLALETALPPNHVERRTVGANGLAYISACEGMEGLFPVSSAGGHLHLRTDQAVALAGSATGVGCVAGCGENTAWIRSSAAPTTRQQSAKLNTGHSM